MRKLMKKLSKIDGQPVVSCAVTTHIPVPTTPTALEIVRDIKRQIALEIVRDIRRQIRQW